MSYLASQFVMDKTIPQGAATSAWACVAPEITQDDAHFRGAYLADCWSLEPAKCGVDASGKVREALWVATMTQLEEATKKK